jgi:hypothetical protein
MTDEAWETLSAVCAAAPEPSRAIQEIVFD